MEEGLCAEEPLGLRMVAHGDCKQQQTTVGKNKKNTANGNKETNISESDAIQAQYWEYCLLEYMVLTGSYVQRTLESSSCCKDTADSTHESGSGLRHPRYWFHTPNTSDVLRHTRKSCRI